MLTSSAMLLVFFYACAQVLSMMLPLYKMTNLKKLIPNFVTLGGYIFFTDSTCFLKLYAGGGQIAYDFSRFYVVLKKVSAKKYNPRGVTDKIDFFW